MFSWHEYRPGERGNKKVLGPLESEIMEVMWEQGTDTARGVYEKLKQGKKIRRSTISIIMNRLCERNLIDKRIEKGKGGQKFIYTVAVQRDEFEKEIVDTVMDSLMRDYPEKTYKYIEKNTK